MCVVEQVDSHQTHQGTHPQLDVGTQAGVEQQAVFGHIEELHGTQREGTHGQTLPRVCIGRGCRSGQKVAQCTFVSSLTGRHGPQPVEQVAWRSAATEQLADRAVSPFEREQRAPGGGVEGVLLCEQSQACQLEAPFVGVPHKEAVHALPLGVVGSSPEVVQHHAVVVGQSLQRVGFGSGFEQHGHAVECIEGIQQVSVGKCLPGIGQQVFVGRSLWHGRERGHAVS